MTTVLCIYKEPTQFIFTTQKPHVYICLQNTPDISGLTVFQHPQHVNASYKNSSTIHIHTNATVQVPTRANKINIF